jgi:uncharacterized protein
MAARILNQTSHRPWPVPTSPWIMFQSWHDLLFAHWPIPADTMRGLLPPELVLDTFGGEAWVGLVPFRMIGVRPRGCPAVPGLSAFLEFNVRTYVKSSNPANPKPGVYFFSLDAANPLAVALARFTYKLPYFRANMSLSEKGAMIDYKSLRTHRGAPAAAFSGKYHPVGDVIVAEPGSIEHWLVERYSLYTVFKNQVYIGEIHHRPWPLQPAFLEIKENTMASASRIALPACQPLLHFARKIDVLIWPIKPAQKG